MLHMDDFDELLALAQEVMKAPPQQDSAAAASGVSKIRCHAQSDPGFHATPPTNHTSREIPAVHSAGTAGQTATKRSDVSIKCVVKCLSVSLAGILRQYSGFPVGKKL